MPVPLRSAAFLLAAVVAACGAAPVRAPAPGAGSRAPADARVVVRAAFREMPLPGARISWYGDRGIEGGVAAASGVTDAKGAWSALLPPGKHFLLAEWRQDDDFARPIAPGDRFAWFGGNPVYVAAGQPREIFLSVEEFVRSPEAVPATPGLAGVVVSGGAPRADVHVFAYLRADGGFRDLGFAASAPTDEKGRFVLDLPPGRYYVVARKRAAGGVAGPLRKGDLFGYYPANPVDVGAGGAGPIVIPVAALKLRNAPAYAGDYAAGAFIEGRIVARDGKPRRGLYAALYDNPDLLNRPVFISDVTGDDGRYRLPVPEAGRYYLGARSGYGGSPLPGNLYGRYEGNAEHAVEVREGDRLTGMDIVVDEVR